MTNTTFDIRWMQPEDLEQVSEICSLSEKFIRKILRMPDGMSIVVSYKNRIIGFILYQIDRKKIKINHIAIDPNFQKQRIGYELINNLFLKLNDTRKTIEAEVCEYNLIAHLFFKKLGFNAVEIIKGNSDTYKFEYSRKK